MNRKRSAPGTSAASGPSKKRKMDNVQKYYAVQAGFRPGVYLTYDECSRQTAGFKGAVCKWLPKELRISMALRLPTRTRD